MGLKFVGVLLVFGLVFLFGCVFIPDVGEDRMTWVDSLEDSLLVASFFSAISAGVSFPAPCSEVWKPKAPQRVIAFGWLGLLGYILTLDNLRKRR